MKKRDNEKEIWDAIVSHVSRGELAEKLLEQVYCDIGPYKRDDVSDETWVKVRDFFEFDDSE